MLHKLHTIAGENGNHRDCCSLLYQRCISCLLQITEINYRIINICSLQFSEVSQKTYVNAQESFPPHCSALRLSALFSAICWHQFCNENPAIQLKQVLKQRQKHLSKDSIALSYCTCTKNYIFLNIYIYIAHDVLQKLMLSTNPCWTRSRQNSTLLSPCAETMPTWITSYCGRWIRNSHNYT